MRNFIIAMLLVTVAATADAGPFRRRQQHLTPTYSAIPTYSALVQATREAAPTDDALDVVNAQRAKRGLRPYLRDEGLMKAAHAAASYRASRHMFGHTQSDFQFLPPGAYATAAGCAAYPASYGFMACAVYDNYTYAGAAWVQGSDGKMYCHAFYR